MRQTRVREGRSGRRFQEDGFRKTVSERQFQKNSFRKTVSGSRTKKTPAVADFLYSTADGKLTLDA